MIDFSKIIGFDWDKWNQEKIFLKHNILTTECEEIFFNQPLLLYSDIKHSQSETRYYVLGKTDFEKLLFVSFTIRKKSKIRVISARSMSRKERNIYIKNNLT